MRIPRPRVRSPGRAATRVAVAGLLAGLVTALPACAQETARETESAGKPRFSAEARRLVEEEGVDAAARELGMLLMIGRDTYDLDLDGMLALGREYLEAGRGDAAVVVLNVALMMDMQSAGTNVALAEAHLAQGTPGMATMYYQQALAHDPENERARDGLLALGEEIPETREEREARREAERRAQEAEAASVDRDRGTRRDDLERFKGRYADPHREVEHWVFWFAETCAGSGYLMSGAAWGDVAPWVLRSESETVFHQVAANPGQEPMRFEFELGADGTPTGARMTGLYDEPTRLERLGPLGAGWQPEGENCRIDAPGG